MSKPHEFYYLVAELVRKGIQNAPFSTAEHSDLVDYTVRITDEYTEQLLRDLYSKYPDKFVEWTIEMIRDVAPEKIISAMSDHNHE